LINTPFCKKSTPFGLTRVRSFIIRKENQLNNQLTFIRSLSDSFADYACKYPTRTAFIINTLMLPCNDEITEDTIEYDRRFGWAVSLVLLLPETVAQSVVSEIRCLSDTSDNRDLIKRFVFEIARMETFDQMKILNALYEFARLESAEPYGGIDNARIIGEIVYGSETMVNVINELTDMLTASQMEGKSN
jgi:hypothetical protein